MDFAFGGYNYTRGRGEFRCYLIVVTGSKEDEAARRLLAGPGNRNSVQLKPANGQTRQVLWWNRLPNDGTYKVYAYHTPANHRDRISHQQRLYGMLSKLCRKPVFPQSTSKKMKRRYHMNSA